MIQKGNNTGQGEHPVRERSEFAETVTSDLSSTRQQAERSSGAGYNAAQPDKSEIIRLSAMLSEHTRHDIGRVRPIANVQSTLPMGRVASHPVRYPAIVVEALRELVGEYNQHFQKLVEANREFATDYRFATNRKGEFVNLLVRIDMQGLPNSFLKAAMQTDQSVVKEVLRHTIFEFENAPAMYQMLQRMFVQSDQQGVFSLGVRRAINDIRQRHQRPVVLLAVTEEKFEVLRGAEFGKKPGEALSSEEVRELSGFDGLMGPKDFREHLEQHAGRCIPLLYVRSSEPPSRLRDPQAAHRDDLLDDAEIRRIVKENAITLNIDGPSQGSDARINDTKAYLEPMGAAFRIRTPEDIRGAQGQLAPAFAAYLEARGVDVDEVARGEKVIRAKPMLGTYGCYGHVRGAVNGKFIRQLRSNMLKRGEYVVQPELANPTLFNPSDEQTYTYIDRNFLVYSAGEIRFLGGMRTLMPVDAEEAKQGRIHGSHESIYQQVY